MILGNKHVREESLPRPLVYCAIAVICIVVNGCGGGLIGSSTGPKDETGTAVYLPRVVSPRIPDALLNRERLASESNLQISSTNRTAQVDTSGTSTTAQSWQQLSPFFSEIEFTRIAVQLELRLLDSVYQSVLARCGELTNDVCVIPAGEIRAAYTQEISDRLASENAENDKSLLGSPLRAANAEQFLNFGDEIVFGEISIKKISETPYAYGLTIAPLSLLPDEHLQLEWSADFSLVRYSLRRDGLSIVDQYHYERGEAAQQLIFSDSVVGTQKNQTPAGLKVTAGFLDDGNVSFEAHINGITYSGEASDNSASASTLSSGENGNTLLQESFVSEGDVVGSTFCVVSEVDLCTDAETEVYYGFPGGFIADEIIVGNLPAQIEYFQVRRNPDVHSMYVPEVLCHVYKEVFLDEHIAFCFADSSVVLGGVVVAIDPDGGEFIVDDATIKLNEAGASAGGVIDAGAIDVGFTDDGGTDGGGGTVDAGSVDAGGSVDVGGTQDTRFTNVGPVVTGNVISWPDDGFAWYQVEDRLTGEIVCSGGSGCTLPDGVYWVSWIYNQENGSGGGGATRVVLGTPVESNITREEFPNYLMVTDKTITWSLGGWYEVQNAQTLETICNGADRCIVQSAGQYIVVNHSLGLRTTVVVN